MKKEVLYFVLIFFLFSCKSKDSILENTYPTSFVFDEANAAAARFHRVVDKNGLMFYS